MELNVKLTADELMNVVNAAMDEAIDRGYCEDDETVDDMLHIVDAALSAMGIEIVPADEDDEDEEEKKPERVDLDLDNPIAQCVFIYDGKRAIKQSDADQIIQAMTEVIETRLGFLPEEIKQQIRTDMLLKVFEDNGVEIVVKDE